MCISRQHLSYLDDSNEEEFRTGRIGYETYVRFADQGRRCWECSLMDNGAHGDMLEECRVRILRYFISSKRDDADRIAARQDRAAAGTGTG